MTLFQLKFGPVVHCSKWYEDRVKNYDSDYQSSYFCLFYQHMSRYLEQNIKTSLTNLINKNCSCNFQTSQIDLGEYSCRSIEAGHVIYRC